LIFAEGFKGEPKDDLEAFRKALGGFGWPLEHGGNLPAPGGGKVRSPGEFKAMANLKREYQKKASSKGPWLTHARESARGGQ